MCPRDADADNYLKPVVCARSPRASQQPPLLATVDSLHFDPTAKSTCGHGRPDRGRVAGSWAGVCSPPRSRTFWIFTLENVVALGLSDCIFGLFVARTGSGAGVSLEAQPEGRERQLATLIWQSQTASGPGHGVAGHPRSGSRGEDSGHGTARGDEPGGACILGGVCCQAVTAGVTAGWEDGQGRVSSARGADRPRGACMSRPPSSPGLTKTSFR